MHLPLEATQTLEKANKTSSEAIKEETLETVDRTVIKITKETIIIRLEVVVEVTTLKPHHSSSPALLMPKISGITQDSMRYRTNRTKSPIALNVKVTNRRAEVESKQKVVHKEASEVKATRRATVATDPKLLSTQHPSLRMHHSKVETLGTTITFRSSNSTRETTTKMNSSKSITIVVAIKLRVTILTLQSLKCPTNREIARNTPTSSFLSQRSRSDPVIITVCCHRPRRAKIQKNSNSLLKIVQVVLISKTVISRYLKRFQRTARTRNSNRIKEARIM